MAKVSFANLGRALEELRMARTRKTARKSSETENVAGGAVESVAEEVGKKTVADKKVQCPFQGCGDSRLYKNLYNMNDHAKIKHGGTYEKDVQGQLQFYAASAERVAMWKQMYDAKKAKDVASRQLRKKVSSPDGSLRAPLVEMKDRGGANVAAMESGNTSVDSAVAGEFPFVAGQDDSGDETDTADDTTVPRRRRNPAATSTATSASVVEESSQDSGKLIIDPQLLIVEPAIVAAASRDKHQIAAEQSIIPPVPLCIAEIGISTKTVAEVVESLSPNLVAEVDDNNNEESVRDILVPKRRVAATSSSGACVRSSLIHRLLRLKERTVSRRSCWARELRQSQLVRKLRFLCPDISWNFTYAYWSSASG